jgi:rod shape-determining protein MreC
MAAFGTGASRPLFGRGGSPGFRFTLYATLSIVIMFLDQRGVWFERVHYVLEAAAYPIQLAVSSPSQAWQWMQESFQTRDTLRVENKRLLIRQRELELRSMRYEALARENEQLRGLRDALPSVAERWLVAEVVNIQLSSLRQRALINRGTVNGIFKGQAILDDKGLVGQTTHVGPWSAEVILITDPEHAVPVQIERTGLRTIAVGTGDTASLALPYLPANADVKAGDLLLTSGLGGVFPAGYPVGRVTEVHRDAVQPLAQVVAVPFARIDTDREVMLVWFRDGHPAAPVAAIDGDAKTGNASMQPQVALHPKPAAPTPAASAPGSPGDAALPVAKEAPKADSAAQKKAPLPQAAGGGDEESPPYETEEDAAAAQKAASEGRPAAAPKSTSPPTSSSPSRPSHPNSALAVSPKSTSKSTPKSPPKPAPASQPRPQ